MAGPLGRGEIRDVSMIQVDLGAEQTPFARRVTLHLSGGDPLDAKRLQHETMAALAEQPRSLMCDLSPVGAVSAELVESLRSVARYQQDWPGTAIGVACVDARLRSRLFRGLQPRRLVVGPSVETVEAMLAALPPAEHATVTLEPGLTAPRSARAFVARACLRWHARSVTGHACLVASELVTNAVLHADTAVTLTISKFSGRLRIAVRDGEPVSPAAPGKQPDIKGSGRGLLLVSSVCRAWGVQPTSDSGKVVWAVLDTTA